MGKDENGKPTGKFFGKKATTVYCGDLNDKHSGYYDAKLYQSLCEGKLINDSKPVASETCWAEKIDWSDKFDNKSNQFTDCPNILKHLRKIASK